MKNLLKILCCSMLLAAQSLVAAPNWSNPIAIYSTPDSSNNGGLHSRSCNIGLNSSGNGVMLYPTIYGINAFGGSAQLTANGALSYPLNNTPLTTGLPNLDYQLNRVVSVSQSIGNSGNALAAWVMSNPSATNYMVQAELLTANAASWSSPTMLTQNSQIVESNITTPQIYLHQDGTGIALWTGNISSDNRICYSTFNGSEWTTDAAIGTQEVTDPNPILLDCPTGSPRVIFFDTDNNINIYSFDGSRWSSIGYGFPYASYYGLKAAAMSNNGNAAAAWIGGPPWYFLVLYKNGGIGAQNIGIVPTQLATTVDNNQNAAYAFIANNGSYYIQSLYWIGTASWTNVTNIQTGAYFLCNLSLQTDAAGNLFAVWESDDANSKGSIWFSYCPYSGIIVGEPIGWTTPIRLSEYSNSYKKPQLAVSPNGNAVITWIKNGTTIEAIQTTSNTYQPQITWFECIGQPSDPQC